MKHVGDRVKETTISTGTGNLAFLGAPSGFRTFASEYAGGERFYYCVVGGAEWEIGLGRHNGLDLIRERVDKSSNSDALVNFSAGTKDIFVTASAHFYYELFQSMFASWRPPISW